MVCDEATCEGGAAGSPPGQITATRKGTATMKSVTIKDRWGALILRVSQKKNGEIDMVADSSITTTIGIDVRDDQGKKVYFHNPKKTGRSDDPCR